MIDANIIDAMAPLDQDLNIYRNPFTTHNQPNNMDLYEVESLDLHACEDPLWEFLMLEILLLGYYMG